MVTQKVKNRKHENAVGCPSLHKSVNKNINYLQIFMILIFSTEVFRGFYNKSYNHCMFFVQSIMRFVQNKPEFGIS